MSSPGLMINGYETEGFMHLKVSLWRLTNGFDDPQYLIEETYTVQPPEEGMTAAQQLRDILVSIAEHL